MKQDLAAKEIEQRLKQEIDRQKFNEALAGSKSTQRLKRGPQKLETATL